MLVNKGSICYNPEHHDIYKMSNIGTFFALKGEWPLKRVLILILSILLIVGITGCRYHEKSASTTVQTDIIVKTTNVTLVCITDTGECYHQNDCFCLWNSSHTITLTTAIERGYRACPHCEPPIK